MSDDHSEVVPLLPIPNRTVKRLCADDSAGSRVKVGHRQTLTASKRPSRRNSGGAFVSLQSEYGGIGCQIVTCIGLVLTEYTSGGLCCTKRAPRAGSPIHRT